MTELLKDPTCWGCFAANLALVLVLTPPVMRLARGMGAVDRGGYRRINNDATPLMGGLAVALPFLGACAYGLSRHDLAGLAGDGARREIAALALGSLAILGVGIIDDLRHLRARTKLLMQVAVGVFVCAGGQSIRAVEVPFAGVIQLGSLAGDLLTIAWIVGIINAFNLIDGMDGLASGVALIGLGALAFLAAINGNPLAVMLCMGLAGGLLGFLQYNFHPARVFLGDTGSMFLGFALATLGLMGGTRQPSVVMAAPPVIAMGFPIFETMISMARRFVRGHPIFAGDQRHTHHRLLSMGLSQRQAVLILYGASVVCAAAAIISGATPARSIDNWRPIAIYVVLALGMVWLAGYLKSFMVPQILRRRRRNKLLRAFSHYALLSLVDSGAADLKEILCLARQELRLNYLEAWYEGDPFPVALNGKPHGLMSSQERDLPIEEIRLKSPGDATLLVRYRPDHAIDDQERQDTAACLARFFEQARRVLPNYGALALARTERKVASATPLRHERFNVPQSVGGS